MRTDWAVLCRRLALVGLLYVLQGAALAESDLEGEAKSWQEIDVQFPAGIREESLKSFYVSAATDNRFFIDLATLSVGSDGVVRYVLLVVTSEGARNVTFEGLRCASQERRIYAAGRRDGSWSKSRNSNWVRIQNVYGNRHHAALYLDYFCPAGVIVRDAAEASDALRHGEHPDNKRW